MCANVTATLALLASVNTFMGCEVEGHTKEHTRWDRSVKSALWCDTAHRKSDNSDFITANKRTVWVEGYHMFNYAYGILGDHMIPDPPPVRGLKDTKNYCGKISLPAPPETNYTTRLQNISDRLWEMGHLITLYHMTVRKLELQQTIFQGEDDVSKLDILGIMLDHYHSSTERYLQASGCSCEGFNCSLHSKQDLAHIEAEFTKGRHPYCTMKLFLGKIITEINTFSQKMHKYFRSTFGIWSVCSAIKAISPVKCDTRASV